MAKVLTKTQKVGLRTGRSKAFGQLISSLITSLAVIILFAIFHEVFFPFANDCQSDKSLVYRASRPLTTTATWCISMYARLNRLMTKKFLFVLPSTYVVSNLNFVQVRVCTCTNRYKKKVWKLVKILLALIIFFTKWIHTLIMLLYSNFDFT